MSTYLGAFFFPPNKTELKIKDFSFLFDGFNIFFDKYFLPYELTEEGFWMADMSGNYRGEKELPEEAFVRLIQKKIDFQAGFSTSEIFGDIGFQTKKHLSNSNPHIFLTWHNKKYDENILSNKKIFLKYQELIKNIAQNINAGYILFCEEAPENFVNCFIDIDGIRYFDEILLTKGPWPIRIFEVWLDYTKEVVLPQGFPLHAAINIGNGFKKYHLDYSGTKKRVYCGICQGNPLI